MSESSRKGAGPAGGLLFLAILLFVGYLVITTIAGVLRWLLGLAFVIVVVALALSAVRRD